MIANSVNHSNKTVVICPPRCASTRLEVETEYSTKWTQIHEFTLTEYEKQGYKIYGAVRHPVERFKSWFYDFIVNPVLINDQHTILSTSPYEWSTNDLTEFIANFKISMHYDSHTMYQKYIWRSIEVKNVTYFEMVYLDILLGKEKNTFKPKNKWKDFVRKRSDLANHAQEAAYKIYKKDIEWYNSIHKIG